MSSVARSHQENSPEGITLVPDHVERAVRAADALIFDCDGTLVLTLDAHERAWRKAFASAGLDMGSAWFRARTAMTADELVQSMASDTGTTLSTPELHQAQLAWFLDEAPHLRACEPVADLARRYHGSKRLAVASNGASTPVIASLRGAGVADLFPVLVTADDGCASKPSPEPLLLAARRMGVPPQACLVLEDSDAGLVAAATAGMGSVDVRSWTLAHPAAGPATGSRSGS